MASALEENVEIAARSPLEIQLQKYLGKDNQDLADMPPAEFVRKIVQDDHASTGKAIDSYTLRDINDAMANRLKDSTDFDKQEMTDRINARHGLRMAEVALPTGFSIGDNEIIPDLKLKGIQLQAYLTDHNLQNIKIDSFARNNLFDTFQDDYNSEVKKYGMKRTLTAVGAVYNKDENHGNIKLSASEFRMALDAELERVQSAPTQEREREIVKMNIDFKDPAQGSALINALENAGHRTGYTYKQVAALSKEEQTGLKEIFERKYHQQIEENGAVLVLKAVNSLYNKHQKIDDYNTALQSEIQILKGKSPNETAQGSPSPGKEEHGQSSVKDSFINNTKDLARKGWNNGMAAVKHIFSGKSEGSAVDASITREETIRAEAELWAMGHKNNSNYLKSTGQQQEDGIAAGNVRADLEQMGIKGGLTREALRKVDEAFKNGHGDQSTVVAKAEAYLRTGSDSQVASTGDATAKTASWENKVGEVPSQSAMTTEKLQEFAKGFNDDAAALLAKVAAGKDPTALEDWAKAGKELFAAKRVETEIANGPLDAMKFDKLIKDVKEILSVHEQGGEPSNPSVSLLLPKLEPQAARSI